MEWAVAVKQVEIQRFSLVSSRSFQEVTSSIDAAIGNPDKIRFSRALAASTSSAELERIVGEAVGASGFIEFIRFDLGAVVRLYRGEQAGRSLRLLVGNPVVMKQMVEHLTDAGSYAPVTILVDERPDGVHLSYDRVASFIAQYGNAAASKVAVELDGKIERLLMEACG
jgi:hypothetical protein